MKLEKDGLGYRAAIVKEGVSFAIDRINETRGEIHGELSVSRAPEGHLLQQRFNVSGLQPRTTAAKYLTTRSPGFDWGSALEEFCVAVLQAERRGEPIRTIGKLPARGAPSFLLEPLLLTGRPTILYGEEGTGKSTLAAAIAVTVATGKPVFHGWNISAPAPVLVLDWEGDETEWNDLIAAISEGNRVEPPDVFYRPCAGPLTAQVHEVAREVAERGVALVVVDSVGLATPSAREGSDAAEGALRLFAALRSIGCTSLLIDHVNKSAAGSEVASGRPYGSVYKPALARAVFELRAAPEADADGTRHMALFHRKGNLTGRYAPAGIRVVRGPGEIGLYPEDVMDDPRLTSGLSLAARIERLLLSEGKMTTEAIAASIGSTPDNVRKTLGRSTDKFEGFRNGKVKEWGVKVPTGTRPGTSPTRDAGQGSPPLGGRDTPPTNPSRPFEVLEGLRERGVS